MVRIEAWLSEVEDNITKNDSFVRQQGQQIILIGYLICFTFRIISSKHPGFREEQEWRVVYLPKMKPSPDLKKEIISIHGEIQPVYKFPSETFLSWLIVS